ncbi:UNVERIFIED_ORG: hypothetical protein M2348_001287 [Sphingomonas sp. R1F5B]
MMDAKNMERAKQIVDGIKSCREAATFEGPYIVQQNSLTVFKELPGYSPRTANYAMSPAMKAAAFQVWRRELEQREARLRREAAQIGLKLED